MLLKTYHNNLNAFALSCNGKSINHLCLIYRDIFNKLKTNHGRKFAVTRMKDFNAIAERYAMYQPIEAIHFLKSDKDGYPKVLNPYKALLRSKDINTVKITLSIFRSVEILRLPVSHDISTVIQPPTYDGKLVEDITNYIPQFVSKLKSLEYKDLYYHYTVKNGPNGPGLHTSDKDFSAVKEDQAIYNAICTISEKFGDTKLPSDDEYNHQSGCKHSKLTQFAEKSGKTRTIAIIDYYSQRALKPLHDSLMSILKSLPSDGTYSQDNVGQYAQEKTKEKSFIESSDMTAFTDLFPAVIQQKLLYCMETDLDLAKSFWTLLSKRTFRLAWNDSEEVTYGTGQPMGAYSSWALCTLAHHLIVHYCAHKLSIKKVSTLYRIIGDDNIISNEILSSKYREVLSKIGCKLNPYKGTRSLTNAENSSAEVAKRIYLNGTNLSPLTPGTLKDLTNLNLLNAGLQDLLMIYEDQTLPSRILSTMIPKEHRERAWMLCLNPINGVIKPGFPGYENYQNYWNDDLPVQHYKTIMLELRRESLINKANQLTEDRMGPYGSWSRMTMKSKLKEDWGHSGNETAPQYAQLECRRHLLSRMRTILDQIDEAFATSDLELLFDVVEYLPDPRNPFKDLKELRRTHASLLVEKVYTKSRSEKKS